MEAPSKTKKQFSIIGSHKTKSVVEVTANIIFIVCAFVAIIAVLAITVYMKMCIRDRHLGEAA